MHDALAADRSVGRNVHTTGSEKVDCSDFAHRPVSSSHAKSKIHRRQTCTPNL